MFSLKPEAKINSESLFPVSLRSANFFFSFDFVVTGYLNVSLSSIKLSDSPLI